MHFGPNSKGNTHYTLTTENSPRPNHDEARLEALCLICLKVVETLAGTGGAWVVVNPPSVPLLNHLKMLGIESEATHVWLPLLQRGWIESDITSLPLRVRLTFQGTARASVYPTTLLQSAPAWYAKVLKHLYTKKQEKGSKPLQLV